MSLRQIMPVIPRKSYARIPEVVDVPNLIKIQSDSFHWFQTEGLRELFDEISPIIGFNNKLELNFGKFWFDAPKRSEVICREKRDTYAASLWVEARLLNRETGEIQTQEVFMGDFPIMTPNGTFIINGAERVVVNQLLRSAGVYFTAALDRSSGRELAGAKLIPNRGSWLEFETSKKDVISVKIDRKRKIPVTVFLRALVAIGTRSDKKAQATAEREFFPLGRVVKEGTDDELLALFADVDNMPAHAYIASTLEKDVVKTPTDALIDIYQKLRPGDPATVENARSALENMLFSNRRYDLGRVGRYKMNARLHLDIPAEVRVLTQQELVQVVSRIIKINNGIAGPDDIDHLGNRRLKTVGELIQNQLRIGLLRMERVVRERMSIREPEQLSPLSLVNIRPVVAATREFFGGSQLSQFMDQTNPLSELTHKRRLSALGPGGLRRERAGFDVRDVHHSHYGRICPIETPEGPNIGLIGSLATYARVNSFGFIETPYRRVAREIENDAAKLVGRTIAMDIADPAGGEPIARRNDILTAEQAERIAALADTFPLIKVRAYVTGEIVYMTADKEDEYVIGQASAEVDQLGQLISDSVSVRHRQTFRVDSPERMDYIDVSPRQITSVSAAMIPFLEHDDANRALMGSNMQRQAVPLLRPTAPIVGTGMEWYAAADSGQVIMAEGPGEVVRADSAAIVVQDDDGALHEYVLNKYRRTNQSTVIDQRPLVRKGDRVGPGTPLTSSSSTDRGDLALGQNVVVAFASWYGGNFEDAILISERVVQNDLFSSVHVEQHEVEAREAKLGAEEITRDIPNVGEEALRDLDENGIIRVGAEVGPDDILVGKITPKGETELSPEEKLLRAIFGEKSREVKDSSLRMPHGEHGVVVDVKIFSRENRSDLPAGVNKLVRVSVAEQRKLMIGDKMAGRHGNKGVISKIVPVEDMPFLPDGTPVDIILNPLGVPARMNIGQVLETHLGWAASKLGFEVRTPVFDGAAEIEIQAELGRAWLMDNAWGEVTHEAWEWAKNEAVDVTALQDDDELRRLYLLEKLGERGYDIEKLYDDEYYARRATLHEWLVDHGYDPDDLLDYGDQDLTLAERDRRGENARRITLIEWLRMYADTIPDTDDMRELYAFAQQVSKAVGWPVPLTGKTKLYNGRTGESFDQPVTVGTIYMLKLHHLVEDKVHARSTGPYSLVTQQPLGGKAQFGGQRFGEMEVWALEAYGAAYILQEMLTVKSDDVTGRVKTYEAIVKGDKIEAPGVPESFKVLVKELQSLALNVEIVNEKGEIIPFGKGTAEEQLPKLGFSLTIPRSLGRSRTE